MLERISNQIEQGIQDGLQLGAQLYVSQEQETVADRAFGQSAPGVPMRPDTINLWLSSTKPLTAIAVAQLWEQGRVKLDDFVIDHIPEFGQHGKEGITLRQVLTHTGGFRSADTSWKPKSWEQTLEMICAARKEPSWPPGEKAGYHVDSGWYVLGEIVRRLDGRPFSQYLREAILLPLGMADSWVGMPEAQCAAYGDRLGRVYDSSKEPMQEQTLYSRPDVVALCRPGGNGRGPARELGLFYESLLFDERLVARSTVARFTAPARVGMRDHTFRHTIDWGLGFILDSKRYGEDVPYGYGRWCSAQTFGHSGNQSSAAFADPKHGLVVVLVFNGLPGEAKHQPRIKAALEALYEDLGLAG